MLGSLKEKDKELVQLQQTMAGAKSKDLLSQVQEIQGVKLLVARLEG